MAKKQRQPAKSAQDGASRPEPRTLYLIKQVQYKTFLRLEAALQPLGVTTTQFRILTTLSIGGKRSSAELSRMFGVKPQSMIKQISLAEIEYGLQVSPGIDQERHNFVRRAMFQYKIWNVDRHTATVYGRIRGDLFKLYASRDKHGRLKAKRPEELLDNTSSQELGIQENDLWIVSVAVQYDLFFITQDKKIQRILDIAKSAFLYDRTEIWSLPSHTP